MTVRLLRPLYVAGSAHETGAMVEMADELGEAYCARGMAERVERKRRRGVGKKRTVSTLGMRRRR